LRDARSSHLAQLIVAEKCGRFASAEKFSCGEKPTDGFMVNPVAVNLSMPPTFSELFCEKQGVAEKDFERVVLRRTLHRAARILFPLLNLDRTYFTADREFIRCVGRISRLGQFDSEAQDFAMDSNNTGFLRRRLKLRVSRERLARLVRQTLRE